MKPQLKYGLLTGIGLIAIFIASDFASNERLDIIGYMFYFVMTAGVFLAIKDARTEAGGFIKYGKALKIGTNTALIAGSIKALPIYVYMKFIHHAMVVQARIESIDMYEAGKWFIKPNSQQIADMKARINWNVSPGSLSIGQIINDLFWGFMLSLIVAAILQKKNPEDTVPDFLK